MSHDAHAAAAAAGHGLDDDRIADFLGVLERLLFVLGRTVASRQHRHARLLHRAPGTGLVAHQLDDVRIGTDESNVAGLADLGKIGAFRQESVARMNGIGAGDLRGADDGGNVQIAVRASGGPDADVLVGKAHVQRVLVGLRIDGNSLDAKLAAGDDHAQRDLAPIRNQDFLEHSSIVDSRSHERHRDTDMTLNLCASVSLWLMTVNIDATTGLIANNRSPY